MYVYSLLSGGTREPFTAMSLQLHKGQSPSQSSDGLSLKIAAEEAILSVSFPFATSPVGSAEEARGCPSSTAQARRWEASSRAQHCHGPTPTPSCLARSGFTGLGLLGLGSSAALASTGRWASTAGRCCSTRRVQRRQDGWALPLASRKGWAVRFFALV